MAFIAYRDAEKVDRLLPSEICCNKALMLINKARILRVYYRASYSEGCHWYTEQNVFSHEYTLAPPFE
jgi:hypothetical protein